MGRRPGQSTVTIDADTYADNGTNGFDPVPGAWDEDSFSTNVFQSNFVDAGGNTFDLGAGVDPLISRDEGGPPDYPDPWRTSASATGLVTINGLGTNTLEINWRATTLNDHDHGEGFLSDSAANVIAQIQASINGVAPGTPVTISYDWEYFATAVPDHEAAGEDPELARGSLSFVDDQGTGPGSLYSVQVGEGEPDGLTSFDDANNSYDLTTSNPMSFVTISLDAGSDITMDMPGSPLGAGFNEVDFAGSEFVGRLTLTLTAIPEPSAGQFLFVAGLTAAGVRLLVHFAGPRR